MRAMVLERVSAFATNPRPLTARDVPIPTPSSGQLLIRVSACGVCHTELDEIEGRLDTDVPRIPGHQIVGHVERVGPSTDEGWIGARVGVAWIYHACGQCQACRTGRENLCSDFVSTGCDVDGGYAEYMTAFADFVYRIPPAFSDVSAAPLLCAGAIGYRSLRLANLQDGQPLGLTGFGASAHLVITMARAQYPRSRVYVFARSSREREFARALGAVWTGGTEERAPEPLAAIIDTTPAWKPVVEALDNLAPGGRLVINAIRKEQGDQDELLRLDYARHLWREKEIKTVANVTRDDVRACLDLAAAIPIAPEVETYPLEGANEALVDLKAGRLRGAKVLLPTGTPGSVRV
ncbi:MAG: zinc-dependent alcohol dehydrogenase family protein [Gemmatimonadota bacterium]